MAFEDAESRFDSVRLQLIVSIEEDHALGARVPQSGVAGGTHPESCLPQDRGSGAHGHSRGVVRRAIVDDDRLDRTGGLRRHAGQRSTPVLRVVAARNDDGNGDAARHG